MFVTHRWTGWQKYFFQHTLWRQQTASLPSLLHCPAWIFLSLMPFCRPVAFMVHSPGYVRPSLAHRGSSPGGHKLRASTWQFGPLSLFLHGSVERERRSKASYVVQYDMQAAKKPACCSQFSSLAKSQNPSEPHCQSPNPVHQMNRCLGRNFKQFSPSYTQFADLV